MLHDPLTFLIDTGADISILKANHFTENLNISNNFLRISGVTRNEILSLGKTSITFNFDSKTLSHNVHLVNSDFPINFDGILGRDFMMKTLAKIDYETFLMTIFIDNFEITIPLEAKLPKSNTFEVPARTEVIKALNLKLEEDSVICNQEVIKGVFVSNTLISQNGIPHVKIVNTLDTPIILENFMPIIEPLDNYIILKISSKPNSSKHSFARIQKLKEELKFSTLDPISKESVINLCLEFADIFHLEDDKLSCNNFYEQHISISDRSPVYIKNYRLPHSHIEEISNEVDRLVKEDIVEPSVSSYNSPLLIVPKKSNDSKQKWRLVVDFRQLNNKIHDDKFPLPRLEDILDNLGKARYFSTLDMQSSFHQIPLDPQSRKYTAFSTNKGHFQYKRLPFGLKISTNSFQRMLTIALAGLEWQAFLYVDDIIVFGSSITQHNRNLDSIFQRLRKFNLKLNPKKCSFLKTEVIYLGHSISGQGVKPDPSKFLVIENYPTPTNKDDVRRFVAFANYYRKFVKDFASIAKPLNQLQKKASSFIWTDKKHNAFLTLKRKLINPPILQYPNFEQKFTVTTDASNFAMGAVLSQGPHDLPICYASKSFSDRDIKKPV